MANFVIPSVTSAVDSAEWRPVLELPVSNHAWLGRGLSDYKFDYRQYALAKGTRWCHVIYYAGADGGYDLKKFAATTEEALGKWEAAGGKFEDLVPSLEDSILTCVHCTYVEAQKIIEQFNTALNSGKLSEFVGLYEGVRSAYYIKGSTNSKFIERYVINPKRLVTAQAAVERDNCPF